MENCHMQNRHIIINSNVANESDNSCRWFKVEKDQLFPVALSDRITEVAQGLLHITRIKLEDRGTYVCVANNSAGKESVHVNLIISGIQIVIIPFVIKTIIL